MNEMDDKIAKRKEYYREWYKRKRENEKGLNEFYGLKPVVFCAKCRKGLFDKAMLFCSRVCEKAYFSN